MQDFRGLVQVLEERGELDRITRAVDPRFEMAALMEQVDRRRRAYLFEQVRGARFPLVGGVLNRTECFGWALGSRPGDPFGAADLARRIETAKAHRIAPREVGSSPAKQVLLSGTDIDLGALPAPTAFELDSGAFITGACGITRNPRTGRLNVGIYRALILGRRVLAINSSAASDLGVFYRHAEQHGARMPIALAIGVEPALLMAASCKLPLEDSELDLAGGLLGRPIELVKCESIDLWVPANAEMIIEGTVDVSRKVENTLGEYAGQYGTETAPVTEVTAITHRRDVLFYSILAGANPEHHALASIAAFDIERELAEELRRQLPQAHAIRVCMQPAFGSMAHVFISIAKRNDAEPAALIEAAFAAAGGYFPVSQITKRIVIVDDDIDVHDLAEVEWAIWTRTARAEKFCVLPDVPSWDLERCARPGRGSLRIALDATIDMADREKLRRTIIPGADRVRLADYLQPSTDGRPAACPAPT